MRDVAVVGVGMIRFDKYLEKGINNASSVSEMWTYI